MRHTSYEDAADLLRAFRRQNSFKQEVISDWLGISQAYCSRIESGLKIPSKQLHMKILSLIEDKRFQPAFERWRMAVQFAPTEASIIRKNGEGIELVELSQGFRAVGGKYATLKSGDRIDGVIAGDIDLQFELLERVGAFSGHAVMAEGIWSMPTPAGARYYRSTTTSVRDDLNNVCLYSNLQPIGAEDYEAAVREDRVFRLISR